MSNEHQEPGTVWDAVKDRVARVFQDALHKAPKYHEVPQLALFGWRAETIIQRKVDRWQYEPRLPVGGRRELDVAKKLTRLVRRERARGGQSRLPDAMLGFFVMLAAKYTETAVKVDRFKTVGRYYIRHLPKSRYNWNIGVGFENVREFWKFAEEKLAGDDLLVRWAIDIALKGIPEWISNFHVEPIYVMEKTTGELIRMVRVHNVHGEVFPSEDGMLELDADSFSAPKPLRSWLFKKSNVAYSAGEKELQALATDMSMALADKVVRQVPCFGFYDKANIWFFDDAAYDDEGLLLKRNKYGAYMAKNGLWLIGQKDAEGEEFWQGRPVMRPDQIASERWEGRDEKEAIRNLFTEAGKRLCETVGDECGWLLFGHVAAAVVMEEMHRRYNSFSGIWFSGESGQGKTSVARWLMRIWGCLAEKGLSLKSTKASTNVIIGQYGSTWVWLDEFQPDTNADIVEILKFAFDRTRTAKITYGATPRQMRAAIMVTGVATSADVQLMNRYFHLTIAATKRQANHYDWFQERSRDFYLLGRYLVQHRREFGKFFFEAMEEWLGSADLQTSEERDDRMMKTQGTGYCGFLALMQLLGAPDENKVVLNVRKRALKRTLNASAEARSSVTVNQFLTLLTDCVQCGAFGHSANDLRNFFNAQVTEVAMAPGMEDWEERWPHIGEHGSGVPWKSYKLYLLPGAVVKVINKHLREQNQAVIANVNDLRGQLMTRPWFIRNAKGDDPRQRFQTSVPLRCWGIELDICPDGGYQHLNERDFVKHRFKEDGLPWGWNEVKDGEWPDPRKGDLYAIAQKVETKEEKGPFG